ncbi:MAG: UDP-N-acetylmuramoyl-L-alanine--D-glutamate ligase [Acidimicrobiaceae bacterium]|nr:UDP-N-acetylmuramoyl-L-alanine--D-glutamate ligase [Acidimicrobiaceae bacterium]
MFRPTGFADLAGRRVGIFGYGIEGRATHRRLAAITTDVVIVDDNARDDDVLSSASGGLDALATCEVVVKSPGIPRRRADVTALEDRGVVVTSALNLWLHDVDRRRVIAVTGTKGKSTTTSLVSFFLRCLGELAQELGNIGQPPYDPDVDVSNGWLVLEVSSFQSLDITVAPALILVTSLGSDHLDWHGTLEQYHDDKLSITRAPGDHVTLIADDPDLEHARALIGGSLGVAAADTTGLAQDIGLLGAHNDHNVGLALAACALVTGRPIYEVRAAALSHASRFVPLRGRLTLIATHSFSAGNIRYVDDGLATAPLPSIAALRVFEDAPLALLAGGFDRGVDYAELGEELRNRHEDTTVVVFGPAGQRIGDACTGVRVLHATNMDQAVRHAHAALSQGGVVLFSPAAPSFDAYRNWAERSDDFARVVHQVIDEQQEH